MGRQVPGQTPQQLIGGRYRLLEVLGRGGMGIVWSAHDELLGRPVAVKEVLPPPYLSEAELFELRQRTMLEARAAARISSPSALTVFDVVEEGGNAWIVMELLAPRTLEDVLAERRLTPQQAAVVGLAILTALRAADAAGVLHRDVKPANVMFRGSDDDMSRAVLTDFGIARFVGDPSVTATGTLVGSPAYVAPERARGEPATLASDLWSLGVTLWKAVEGYAPFQREGPLPTITAVVTEEVPEAQSAGPLGPVLDGLLRKDPQERMSVLQLRDELHAVVRAGSSPPPGPVPSPTAEMDVVSQDVGSDEPAVLPVPVPVPVPVTTEATPAPTRPRRRLGPLVGALAALLLAAAVTVVWAPWDRSVEREPEAGSGAGAGAGSQTTAPAGGPASSPTPSTSPPASTPSPSSTTTTTTTVSGPVVPAGHRFHRDTTGFAVAVPEGWTESRRGSSVRFSDPASSASLLVDQTDDPKDDPVADWQAQERSVSQRLNDYQLVGEITGHQLRGWQGADWEFTYSSEGEVRHALNRNLVTTPGQQAYALLWTVPHDQWEERRDDFDAVFASFQPRSPS